MQCRGFYVTMRLLRKSTYAHSMAVPRKREVAIGGCRIMTLIRTDAGEAGFRRHTEEINQMEVEK